MSYQNAQGKNEELIVRCSDLPDEERGAEILEFYTTLTGDTEVSCMSESISGCENGVWFLKSCRENKDRCVPLIIQYSMDFAMQVSYFLDMPLAIMLIASGKDDNYQEYYSVIRETDCMFGWYSVYLLY